MIEAIWRRIVKFEVQRFKQIKGGEFTYRVLGNTISLSRTNRTVSKNNVAEALKYVPLKNTAPLQKLQAPSYLVAIIMDNRIRRNDW